jgi:tetratricopeptide (TPR) repeat protein
VRHYERALDLAHRALELHSDSALGLYALGLVSSQSGSYDRAIEAYVRLLAITNRASVVLGMLGCAYACAGRISEATLLLNELVDRASRQFVDPLPLALIYVALGDRENLEQQLNHIVEQHGTFANVEQILGVYLDPLADERRFQDLFTRLHLPERKPSM